jgi:ubiquinone/menaquinone biosynthesis C-methylase UbiE
MISKTLIHLGDIAFRFTDKVRSYARPGLEYSASVQVLDINPNMLQVGQGRAAKLGFSTGNNLLLIWKN